MASVFLSYRREDSRHQAGRLYDRLAAHFGAEQVFKDVDSIPLGSDFLEVLTERVAGCDVFLALIGDHWLSIAGKHGKRRLDDDGDFVRIEIEAALGRKIPVIPVLVGDSPVPSADELPKGLRKLALRNGLLVRPDPDFHKDVDRLIRGIESAISLSRERQAEGKGKPSLSESPHPVGGTSEEGGMDVYGLRDLVLDRGHSDIVLNADDSGIDLNGFTFTPPKGGFSAERKPRQGVRFHALSVPRPSANDECTVEQEPVRKSTRRIGAILVDMGYIDEEGLWKALEEQKRSGSELLGKVAVRLGLVKEEPVLKALGEQLGMKVMKLEGITIPSELTKLVNEKMARAYKVVPVSQNKKDNSVTVAMAEPQNPATLDSLAVFLGVKVKGVIASEAEVMAATRRLYAGY